MLHYDLRPCACPACGSSDIVERFEVSDFRDHCGPDTFYVRCRQCQCLYLNPVPVPISAQSHDSYNERYRNIYSGLVRKLQHPLKRQLILLGYSLLSGPVRLNVPRDVKPGQNLLDVGCGLGLQTKYFAKRGVRITGMDKCEQAISFARQLATAGERFLTKTIFELEEKHLYDYGRIDNVLEHIDKPRPFLLRIRELLKPRGHLVVFTPNADAWSIRLLKGKSVLAWSPEHLIIYSRTALEHLLSKTGFKIESIRYSTPAWWMAYNMALLCGLKNRVSADSLLFKVGGLISLPFAWIGQRLGMNEELVIEAEQ